MKKNLVFFLVFSLLLAAFAFPMAATADGSAINVNTGSITGCSIGVVQNGSWVVTPATVAGNETSFNLPDNGKDYEIRISKGGMSTSLIGRPGQTLTAPVESITLDTGLVSGCTVSLVQNGSYVYSPVTLPASTTSFDVFKNNKEYEIRVNKGGMAITLYGQAGDAVVTPIGTLTLDTGVIADCTVSVVQNGSYVYTPVALTGSTATYAVFANKTDYEVRVGKGGMAMNLYGQADETLTVPVKKLTVNTGSVSDCSVGVVQNGSWVYSPVTITGNQTDFDVFDNNKPYEIRLGKGGMGITLYGQAGYTSTAPTYALQIPSGLSNIGLVQNGSWVYQNIPSPGSVNVFMNGQQAELRYTLNGSATVQKFPLDGMITGKVKLRILFANMNDIHVNVYNAAGVNLGWQGINRGQQEADYANVAPGAYRVNLSKYGAVYEKNINITVADAFANSEWNLDTQPAAVTIRYPGIGNVNLSVKSKTNPSSDVAYSQSPDQSTVYLFRNWTYSLAIAKAGVVYRQDIVLGDVPSLDINVPVTTVKVLNIMGVNGAGMAVRYRLPGGASDFQYMQTAQDGSVSATVFSDMDYEIIISQYAVPGYLYDTVVHVVPDANGEYIIDLGKLESAVTVDYTGLYYAPNVYLYDASGKQIGYSQSADKSVFNLKKGKYTVKLHKNGLIKEYPFEVSARDAYAGSKTVTIPLINLTIVQPGGVNYACNINVIPVNGSGNIAYSQSGAETVTGMKLFPNETYKVYFNGGMNYTGTFTVGTEDYTYTVPTATVTFDTTGIPYGYGMNLFVTNASNNVTAQYRQTVRNSRYPTALIPGNTYIAKIYTGSTLYCTRTFTVQSDMTVHLFSALFVDAGIPGCSIGVVQNGSWVFSPKAITGTTTYFAVPDNGKNYEVRISKGGMSISLSGPAYSDIAAPVKSLTVNTGSITGCSVGIVQNGSWVYSPAAVSGNTVSFNVFDNGKSYEVRVSKGGMSINLPAKAGDTVTVPVGTLTVDTGSITGCSVGIVQNGSWVYSPAAVSGSTVSFDVFDNGKSYEVRVSKGGMSINLPAKAGDTVTVPVGTLTVDTGSITGCSVGIVQNGSWVYSPAAVSGSTVSFDVFDNGKNYEVRSSKGGMSITLYGKAGDTVTVPVKKLGVCTGPITDCSVGIVQNGSWVYSPATISGSTASFDVFANLKPYEIRISKGGMSITLYSLAGFSVTTPTCTFSIPVGIKNVGIVQNGSWVYQNIPSPGQVTVFLNGQLAELRYTKGSRSLKAFFAFLGNINLKFLLG